MKNFKWLLLVALAAFAVACDPYDDVKSGTPEIASVTASDVGGGVGFRGAPTTGGAWAVDITCDALCDAYNDECDPDDNDIFDNYTDLSEMIVWVTFDRQINGNAVQTSVESCVPAGGWLSASPAPAATESWFSCYAPSSADPNEGGSAVLFTAETPAAGAFVNYWGDSFTAPPAGQLTFTGTVAGRAIDVTVNRIALDTGLCVCEDPVPLPPSCG